MPPLRSVLHMTAVTAATVSALAAGRAAAQTPAARPAAATVTALDATTRRDVVDTIAAQLRRHYVDADTGRLIAEHIERRLKAGAYESISDPYRFADVLTDDLRAVNGDLHLRVIYDPEAPFLTVGAEGIRMPRPDGPGRRAPSPAAIENARRTHFALGRVDVLPGNVGYFDVRGFLDAPEARDAVVAALRYLESTDAVIIDLRRNGGGSPNAVNFLISHFTGADTLASLTVRNRSGNESFTRYTLASVPGPRRPAVPLYVLTSGLTASAGEDCAFVLKNLGRATLVGAVTAGAGHNNATLASGHGFGTSISFTRVMDPRTAKEWERVGVQPDVAVPQERALAVAHSLALKALAEREQDAPRRRLIELTREAVEAQLAERQVPAAALASHAGQYEGGRTVTVEGGKLLYAPLRGAPPDELVPLGNGTFANGVLRYAFERDAAGAMRLRITFPGGESMTYARVPAGARRG